MSTTPDLPVGVALSMVVKPTAGLTAEHTPQGSPASTALSLTARSLAEESTAQSSGESTMEGSKLGQVPASPADAIAQNSSISRKKHSQEVGPLFNAVSG